MLGSLLGSWPSPSEPEARYHLPIQPVYLVILLLEFHHFGSVDRKVNWS